MRYVVGITVYRRILRGLKKQSLKDAHPNNRPLASSIESSIRFSKDSYFCGPVVDFAYAKMKGQEAFKVIISAKESTMKICEARVEFWVKATCSRRGRSSVMQSEFPKKAKS